jgi:hypothetical protein
VWKGSTDQVVMSQNRYACFPTGYRIANPLKQQNAILNSWKLTKIFWNEIHGSIVQMLLE